MTIDFTCDPQRDTRHSLPPFNPAPWLKPTAIQTILASIKLRARGANPMKTAAREMVFESNEGIRLLGYHSPQPGNRAKGLVILLHGWEGSVDSTYVLNSGRWLFQNGYSVFRLNFRDHGCSHHLNPGLFLSTNLNEVVDVIRRIAAMAEPMPIFLAGFSLGGNFALRSARRFADKPVPNLMHVVSISPVIDPDKATDRIDASPLIQRYFQKKWIRSLKIKKRRFPDRYDFEEFERSPTIRGMTRILLDRYSAFSHDKEYFRGYALTDDIISAIRVPATVVTSKDDPIIPVDDFYTLPVNPVIRRIIHPCGGHNGFVDGHFYRGWYDDMMVRLFDQLVCFPQHIDTNAYSS